jgi:hypothetical protein
LNALEFLISLLTGLCTLLSVLAAYRAVHSTPKFKMSAKALPQLNDCYHSNDDSHIFSDPDVIKTIEIIRDSVSRLNAELAESSNKNDWYSSLMDSEFKSALLSTVSKCLRIPTNELSKQIIETLFVSTSSFLRAAKLLYLNKDVQSAIAEYAEICSIAKCRVDFCNAYVETDSAVNNESTYNRDSNFANRQISDRNILVG